MSDNRTTTGNGHDTGAAGQAVATRVFSEALTADLEVEAGPDTALQIEKMMGEIDMEDSNSIIFFGNQAQQQLTTISDTMLEGVRAKDVGPAGQALSNMVHKIRELDVSRLDPYDKPGFFARLFGAVSPVMKFIDQYDEVRDQIEKITDELEEHKTKLLTDIAHLDRLYDANLDYFHDLEIFIAAGRAKLEELDNKIIPDLAAVVEKNSDVIEAQKLRDLRSARDDLERRVHDLLLTRQVTMQSLPSIRLVQENDKSLVNKITSTTANTIPLWRQQLAQAITIYRSGEAAKTVKEANDLTNELLKSNAENLKQANAEVRRQVERGVFDIETVAEANKTLIDTIEESLQIADEGKARRRQAEHQLIECEAELRRVLVAATGRTDPELAKTDTPTS